MGQKSIPTVAIGKPVEGQPGTFANERIVNESDFEGIYKAKGYEIVDLPDRAPGVRSPGRNADSGIKPAAPESTEGATGSGNALGDTSTPESATGDSGDEFDALKGDIPDPNASDALSDTPPNPEDTHPNGKDPIDPPMKQPSNGEGPLTEPLGGQ